MFTLLEGDGIESCLPFKIFSTLNSKRLKVPVLTAEQQVNCTMKCAHEVVGS